MIRPMADSQATRRTRPADQPEGARPPPHPARGRPLQALPGSVRSTARIGGGTPQRNATYQMARSTRAGSDSAGDTQFRHGGSNLRADLERNVGTGVVLTLDQAELKSTANRGRQTPARSRTQVGGHYYRSSAVRPSKADPCMGTSVGLRCAVGHMPLGCSPTSLVCCLDRVPKRGV